MKSVTEHSLEELSTIYKHRIWVIKMILLKFPFDANKDEHFESEQVEKFAKDFHGVEIEHELGEVSLVVSLPRYERKGTLSKYVVRECLARKFSCLKPSKKVPREWHNFLRQTAKPKLIPSCSLHNESLLMIQMLEADYFRAIENHPDYGPVEKNLSKEIDELQKKRANLYDEVFKDIGWPDYSQPFMF